MILNLNLAFLVCCGIHDSLCWAFWVPMIPVDLVSVSKILMFAFHHLEISGVRCSSCLWLELVPPVVLLSSWEINSLLCPSGQNTLCRQALLLQRRCTEVWSSDPPPEFWGQSLPCRLSLFWQGRCPEVWVSALPLG